MIEWVRDNFDKLVEEMLKLSTPTTVSHDEEREKVTIRNLKIFPPNL